MDSIETKELKYDFFYHFTVVRLIHDHMGISDDRQRWRSGYFIAELCNATELQVEMQHGQSNGDSNQRNHQWKCKATGRT